MNHSSNRPASPEVPAVGSAISRAAHGEGGQAVRHVMEASIMGKEGNGLRSRGYQVRILAAAPRKRRPPIPNVLKPGTMLVPLTQGRFAIIDEADAAVVSQRTWCVQRDSKNRNRLYVGGKFRGRSIKLHRFLWAAWGMPSTPEIDHINGDGLDNRRSNLRAATRSQNLRNQPAWNSAGLPKGCVKSGSRFRAVAHLNGRPTHLGMFDTVEEASAAYLKAVRRECGEFARAS